MLPGVSTGSILRTMEDLADRELPLLHDLRVDHRS